MSEEIKNTQQGTAANPEPKEGEQKPFTQEDVNRIISERLAREKEKAAADLEQREKDLAIREFKLKAKETLAEKKLPEDLLEVLDYSDQEKFNKGLEVLEKYVTKTDAPRIVLSSGMSHGSELSGYDRIRGAMGLK